VYVTVLNGELASSARLERAVGYGDWSFGRHLSQVHEYRLAIRELDEVRVNETFFSSSL
jgi:hypothetical protein